MQMEQNDDMAQANQEQARAHDAGYGRNTAETDRTLASNNYRTVNGVKYDMGQQLPASSNF